MYTRSTCTDDHDLCPLVVSKAPLMSAEVGPAAGEVKEAEEEEDEPEVCTML